MWANGCIRTTEWHHQPQALERIALKLCHARAISMGSLLGFFHMWILLEEMAMLDGGPQSPGQGQCCHEGVPKNLVDRAKAELGMHWVQKPRQLQDMHIKLWKKIRLGGACDVSGWKRWNQGNSGEQHPIMWTCASTPRVALKSIRHVHPSVN